MAALGTVTQLEDALDSYGNGNGVVTTYVSGAGTDATELIAAVASTQQYILGGALSTDGGAAESMAFKSGSTVISTIQFGAVAQTIDLSALRGVHTDAGEALNVDKSGATAVMSITLHTVPIKAGMTVPHPY